MIKSNYTVPATVFTDKTTLIGTFLIPAIIAKIIITKFQQKYCHQLNNFYKTNVPDNTKASS